MTSVPLELCSVNKLYLSVTMSGKNCHVSCTWPIWEGYYRKTNLQQLYVITKAIKKLKCVKKTPICQFFISISVSTLFFPNVSFNFIISSSKLSIFWFNFQAFWLILEQHLLHWNLILELALLHGNFLHYQATFRTHSLSPLHSAFNHKMKD